MVIARATAKSYYGLSALSNFDGGCEAEEAGDRPQDILQLLGSDASLVRSELRAIVRVSEGAAPDGSCQWCSPPGWYEG
jgi:hypothetical protein